MRASLSLDLDNKWSYMKTHGNPGWTEFPTYLPQLVPVVLDLLDKMKLRITFFIVGQDAERPENAEVLGEIARRGHEIGNHSHHHEPWMHRRGRVEIDDELRRAEEAIERVTGVRPRGFRGPGFTRSETILETLVARGYLYDASSLATFIGPLARAYYFRSAKLSAQDRAEREDLFGSFADGFRRNSQHQIELSNGAIAEIPVTTFPLAKIPIHVSYVLYIAMISPVLARAYFESAMTACKLTHTEPSILLHPLDFLTAADAPELRFFPAMAMDPEVKRRVAVDSIAALAKHFDVRPMKDVVNLCNPASVTMARENQTAP